MSGGGLVSARSVLVVALFLLAGCGGRGRPAVEDLQHREGLSAFKVLAVRGVRSGAHLDTQALFSDSSSILTVEMRFLVGTPATLATGSWHWPRGSVTAGEVAAREITFLGGQDGPPSIGGTFDLLDPGGTARYRINIPVTELKAPPVR